MKKKICYLNDVVFSGSSGELTHTVGLLNALVKRNHEVTYITFDVNSDILSEYNISEKVKVNFIKYSKFKLLSKSYYYFYFYKIFWSLKVDYIYVRETFFSLFLYPFVFFNSNNKILFEFNGIRVTEESNNLKKTLINLTDKLNSSMYKRVFKNVSVSKGIELLLKDRYSLENTVTINNGTDLSICKFKTKENNNNNLVFIGNLSSWQNFELLLNIVYENKEELSKMNFYVDIFGDGKEKGKIINLINSLNLNDIVFLRGKIKKENIPEVLINSSLGLLIDKRFYKGHYLFSPLKYYEYSAIGLKSILLNDNMIINEDLEGVYISNKENFIEKILEATVDKAKLVPRTWPMVVSELELILNE